MRLLCSAEIGRSETGAVTGNGGWRRMTVPTLWADIENAPQVQYLLPIARAARSLGAPTLVTARDYGETFDLLTTAVEVYAECGTAYGASRLAKVRGVIHRVRALERAVRAVRPEVLVSASRAAALAAWRMRVRSYAILDYEFVDTRLFRLSGATVLYPDAIPARPS